MKKKLMKAAAVNGTKIAQITENVMNPKQSGQTIKDKNGNIQTDVQETTQAWEKRARKMAVEIFLVLQVQVLIQLDMLQIISWNNILITWNTVKQTILLLLHVYY